MSDERLRLTPGERKNLRDLYEKRFTQEKLADQAGISLDTLKQMLGKKGDKDSVYKWDIEKVAEALGCHPTEFMNSQRWNIEKSKYTRRFQVLIEEKIRKFVGREFVFKAFEKFIETHDRGYFTVVGDPGEGKSTVAAEYVNVHPSCLYYFNSYNSQNRVDQFLECICQQLICEYGLEDYQPDSLPKKTTEDNIFLTDLLQQVSDKLKPHEKAVIVVDALDEVNLSYQQNGSNILYLPRYLPKGVYFLLTRRRELETRLLFETPQEIFDFKDYTVYSREDIKKYIDLFFDDDEFKKSLDEWIVNQNLRKTEFIDKLTEKSENNFMYLKCVLPEIAKGYYQNLQIENLPQSLTSYYEDHWQRMVMEEQSLFEAKVYVIYILLQSDDPISLEVIDKYVNAYQLEVNAITLQQVLKAWNPFLDSTQIEDEKCYKIYHASFADFLRRRDTIKAAKIDIYNVNKKMHNVLFNDFCVQAQMSACQRLTTLKSLPRYLARDNQIEKQHQILTDFEFMQAKIEAVGIQALIEDYQRVEHLETDETLRLLQRTFELSAHVLNQDTNQLASQLWGRLLSYENNPPIQQLLQQAKRCQTSPWLRPTVPNSTPPGGALIRTLVGHTDSVWAVVISSDGSKIVSCSEYNIIKVWDLASGQQLLTLSEHDASVVAVAISPDGKKLVSGSDDGTIKVWDLASGKQLSTLSGHDGLVSTVAISPDGEKLVLGSEYDTMKVWDLATGKEPLTLVGHTDLVMAVAISPDGKKLVSGSEYGTIEVWDLANGKQLLTLSEHDASVVAVAISPDGEKLVSSSDDHTIKVWDLASGQQLLTLNGHSSFVWAVAISPDCSKLVSGSNDNTIKVWDLASGQQLLTLSGHSDSVLSVAISPDGKKLVSGSDDGTIKVWDLASAKPGLTLTRDYDSVRVVAISPDGSKLVSGSVDNTIKVWDLASGKQLLTLSGHDRPVNAVTISPDGSKIVSDSSDNTIKVWDLVTGKQLLSLSEHDYGLLDAVAISPDGSKIVSSSWSMSNTIKVLDLKTGKELLTLTGHDYAVGTVAISPDGSKIVLGSSDNTIKVLDLKTGKELLTLTGHDYAVGTVAISPDGSKIVSGSSDNTIKVLDLKTGKELLTLTGHDDSIMTAAISPDGSKLVSCSTDNTIKVWGLATGEELLTLNGHNSFVTAVVISPDGLKVVSGSDDKTVKVWDLNTGKQMISFIGDSDFNCCAISPDNQTIVAGDSSGMLHFLRIEGLDVNGVD